MSATISSINYCPVKSISFQSIDSCQIKKNIGISGDRVFAFAKNLDSTSVINESLIENPSNLIINYSIRPGIIFFDILIKNRMQ